jgi:hypothetical protein
MNITILDIVHFRVFYLKCSISETGFCFRLVVVSTQLGPIDRVNSCLRTRERDRRGLALSSVPMITYFLMTETEPSLQAFVFYIKERTIYNVQNYNT